MKLSELSKLIIDRLKEYGDMEVEVSVDVSTGENDYDHRIFAEVIYLVNQNTKWSIECNKTEDNYDKK